ncbi:glycosyltransferase [Kaistella palustris]|uniref:glycosyltransferase n=1 Tax=Kaistella palustris TaxID=493376 RepID=UPI00041592DE|nr:glycosyltransferase [Kaistella palustris]
MIQEAAEIVANPLLSVIIITYNQEKYIRQTVESILAQSCDFDFEIIIGDDCSTDRTRTIIRKLQKKHSKTVRLLLQEKNQGITKNYLSALALCRGKYIAQIAGDDYWNNPLKVQKQVDILKSNPEIGLIYTDVDFYHEETRKTEHAVFKNNPNRHSLSFEDHLLKKGFIAPMTWMYRSELSPLKFSYTEDYADESFPYILDLLQHSKVFYLDEVTAVRRVIPESASHQTDIQKNYKYLKGVFKIQKEYLRKYNASPEFEKEVLSGNYIELLPFALQLKDEKFIAETKSFFKENSLSYSALERLSNTVVALEKRSSNKVNLLYLKLRKKF